MSHCFAKLSDITTNGWNQHINTKAYSQVPVPCVILQILVNICAFTSYVIIQMHVQEHLHDIRIIELFFDIWYGYFNKLYLQYVAKSWGIKSICSWNIIVYVDFKQAAYCYIRG